MKRILTFFFVFFLIHVNYSQNIKWVSSLDTLEQQLLKKDYLFKHVSKADFKEKIAHLKNTYSDDVEVNYWQLQNLLFSLKIPHLELRPITFKRYPYKIKRFGNQFHLVGIQSKYEGLLGTQVIGLNNILIQQLLNKTQSFSDINVISFLKNNDISTDTIVLNLITPYGKKESIKVSSQYEEMVEINPKKIPFHQYKKSRWYWMYGINFGQQVYVKFNLGLSSEYIKHLKDSLNILEIMIAKQYHLPLQQVYDAPSFNDFTNKIFLKLKNRRYKKLFIDFRNMTIADTRMLNEFIKKIKRLRRINKKKKFKLLVDSRLSSSALAMVLKLKDETNCIIIGEIVNKAPCNTNEIKSLYLNDLGFQLYYPSKYFSIISLRPDTEVQITLNHYIYGIDPIFQKSL